MHYRNKILWFRSLVPCVKVPAVMHQKACHHASSHRPKCTLPQVKVPVIMNWSDSTAKKWSTIPLCTKDDTQASQERGSQRTSCNALLHSLIKASSLLSSRSESKVCLRIIATLACASCCVVNSFCFFYSTWSAAFLSFNWLSRKCALVSVEAAQLLPCFHVALTSHYSAAGPAHCQEIALASFSWPHCPPCRTPSLCHCAASWEQSSTALSTKVLLLSPPSQLWPTFTLL